MRTDDEELEAPHTLRIMIPKNQQISGIQILNENFALQFLSFELNLFCKGQTINYSIMRIKHFCCQAKLQVRIKNNNS